MATTNSTQTEKHHTGLRLPISVDLLAIGIGLTLAVLIRFNVIHQIGFSEPGAAPRPSPQLFARSRPMSTQIHSWMPIAAESSSPSMRRALPTRLGPLRPVIQRAFAALRFPASRSCSPIGLLGKLLQHILPLHIEYVLWAIILGLAVSNFLGVATFFRPGIATYELWLKLGIILVGARFLLQDVLHVGGLSLGLVAVELVLSLSVMTLLGRIFKLPPKLTSLLAIGSSICGVTAIMAAGQGAIDPEEEDTSTAIAAILTLGAIALSHFSRPSAI